jgi:hypothetical protein
MTTVGNAYEKKDPFTSEITYEFLKGEHGLISHLRVVHNRNPTDLMGNAILPCFKRDIILLHCAIGRVSWANVPKISPLTISDTIHPEVLNKWLGRQGLGPFEEYEDMM